MAVTDDIHQYILDHSLRDTELLKRLRHETARLPGASMQIGPEQGQLMALQGLPFDSEITHPARSLGSTTR